MPDVITAGEILVEIIARKRDQGFDSPGEFLGPYPSGAPAIFIDQVARMCISCGIIARVGKDDFGRLNIYRLKEDNVDTSRIKVMEDSTTGTAFVTYSSDGRRSFIYHFVHSAAGRLCSKDIEPSYVKSAKFLHVMGCSLTATDSMRKAILKAVRIAANNGVSISFDPNIRPELLSAEKIRKVFQKILPQADIVLTGREEMFILTGTDTLSGGAAYLMDAGVKTVVVKKGADGAEVFEKELHTEIPPFKAQEVDPTGAGDCFDGAFIASVVRGRSFSEAATAANAAGALAVRKTGPMEGASYMKDIEKLLREKQY